MSKIEEYEDKLFATPEKAVEELQSLCKAGDLDAMYVLGMAFYDAEGVPRNTKLAAEFLLKSADKGHIRSAHDLGCFYYYGYGFEEGFQSYVKAIQYLSIAAESSYCPSLTFLGEMYKSGEGTPVNAGKAKQLFSKAAKLGDEQGKKLLNEIENT